MVTQHRGIKESIKLGHRGIILEVHLYTVKGLHETSGIFDISVQTHKTSVSTSVYRS
jgi:hypothetical protein